MQARSNLKRSFIQSTILASLALALIPILSTAVQAQQPKASISVSPPSYELSANPGDEITNTIRVDNPLDQPLNISAGARNFTALGEEGQVNLTEDDGTYSLSRWITISPSAVVVGPRQSQEFNYTIKVPANAEPGGRFGSIVFKTAAKPLEGQSGVSVGQEIGSLVFLKIAGNVEEKASIASFKALHGINEYKPVGFEMRVKNAGNVHLRPTGSVTITDFFGKKVATVPLDAKNVLPDTVRKMEAEWKEGGRLLFGKYTATVSVVYGSKNQVTTASTSFWGLPYKLILVVLGVLVLVGMVLYKGRRRIKLALRALSGKN